MYDLGKEGKDGLKEVLDTFFFSRVKTIWGMEQIAEDKGSGEGQSDNKCACGKESPGGEKLLTTQQLWNKGTFIRARYTCHPKQK